MRKRRTNSHRKSFSSGQKSRCFYKKVNWKAINHSRHCSQCRADHTGPTWPRNVWRQLRSWWPASDITESNKCGNLVSDNFRCTWWWSINIQYELWSCIYKSHYFTQWKLDDTGCPSNVIQSKANNGWLRLINWEQGPTMFCRLMFGKG